jgi:hypothetical protein
MAFAALAFAVGVFLRAWQLGAQILTDDEWHAIQKLLTADYGDIATHFGYADYCIPFTVFFKFLAQHDSLTEWSMRGPVLACGVALIPLAPWLMRRRADASTLAVWCGLLAISPMMVYHSRVVRPYAITTLLVFVALIALYRWWTQTARHLRWAAIYVICAAAAAWLHLITLPFLLMPFVYFGIAALVPRGAPVDWRRFAALIVIGTITATTLAALLLPPIIGDWNSVHAKSGQGHVAIDTVYRMLLIVYGTANPGTFVAISLTVCIGAVSWWRRDAFFVGYIATICLVAALAIGASRPAWIQHQLAYARYLQPAVPFVLLFAAEGLSRVARLIAPARAAIPISAVAALFVFGPLPGYYYDPNQFMASVYFQFDYDPAHNLLRTDYPAAPVPGFYRKLAEQPPRSLTLVEAPWSILSFPNPLLFYQQTDHQLRRIGLAGTLCGKKQYGEFDEHSGIHFQHFVDVEALMRGEHHGDFLILHRKPWLLSKDDWPDIDACLPSIQATLGAPAYDDGDIAVFALTDKARAIVR